MPKAILEFNLPEEQSEYYIVHRGGEFYSALCEIERHCRSVVKYGHSYKNVEALATYIRELIPYMDE